MRTWWLLVLTGGRSVRCQGQCVGEEAGRTPASVTNRESGLPTQLDHPGLLTNTVGGFVKNCSPLDMIHADICLPVER